MFLNTFGWRFNLLTEAADEHQNLHSATSISEVHLRQEIAERIRASVAQGGRKHFTHQASTDSQTVLRASVAGREFHQIQLCRGCINRLLEGILPKRSGHLALADTAAVRW